MGSNDDYVTHVYFLPQFSASPGRYSLSDIKNCEGSNQSVNIIAEYPWGKYLIETLKLHTAMHESLNPQSLQVMH